MSLQLMDVQSGVAGPTSHVSAPSRHPLPPTPPQSLSLVALQPPGQQPSLTMLHAVIVTLEQVTLHDPLAPFRLSVVHELPSLQVMLAQVGVAGETSQVSPASIRPLPQPGQST